MAIKHFTRYTFTGGASNALDSIDGDKLSDGDTARVYYDNVVYDYNHHNARRMDVMMVNTNLGDSI